MFLGPWACGSECCSSNSNAPDISQKGLIGIQSHHSREKMSKKAREKPAEAGSASVSPYGSVLGYELVTSQRNRLINLIWPECRTWFMGPWSDSRLMIVEFLEVTFSRHGTCKLFYGTYLALARSSPTRRYTGTVCIKMQSFKNFIKQRMIFFRRICSIREYAPRRIGLNILKCMGCKPGVSKRRSFTKKVQ